MRKRYRLTESRLRGMIREAVKNTLNEAYGTAPENDAIKYDNLEYGSNNHLDYMRQSKNKLTDINGNVHGDAMFFDSIDYGFQQVLKGANLLYHDRTDTQDAYLDKIINLAEKGLNINRLLKNKAKMKLGLQPDSRYDARHL